MPGVKETVDKLDEINCNLPPEEPLPFDESEDPVNAKETIRDMAVGIVIFAVLMAGIGCIFVEGKLQWVLGVLLGAGTAGLILWHMVYTLDRALDMNPDDSVKYTKKSALMRMGIAVIAYLIGGFLPNVFHVIGVVFGTFCLKLTAYSQPLIHKALQSFSKGR